MRVIKRNSNGFPKRSFNRNFDLEKSLVQERVNEIKLLIAYAHSYYQKENLRSLNRGRPAAKGSFK
jgi:hypothetical protein